MKGNYWELLPKLSINSLKKTKYFLGLDNRHTLSQVFFGQMLTALRRLFTFNPKISIIKSVYTYPTTAENSVQNVTYFII